MTNGGAGVVHDTEVIYRLARDNSLDKALPREFGGIGDWRMNVDGSVTPVEFDIFANNDLYISKVNIRIIDGGITPSKFGGINNGLADGEGMLIGIYDPNDNITKDFLDGEEITTNAAWSILSGAANIFTSGSGDDLFGANWDIAFSLGGELYIPIECKLRFTVRADLTDIDSFAVMAQGHT